MTNSDRYTKALTSIERLVKLLNEAIGGGVTFGYIGNVERWGDDRSWMVFLPHPGRVGTDGDHIGGFSTNDDEGAWLTVAQLQGALKMAKYRR
jgi:hypothetical protein